MRTPRSVTYSAVLVGYVLGIVALYSGLPTEIPPSWTASNGDVLRLGTSMVAFLLPTAVTVTDILLRGLCVRHPIDQHSTVNVLAIFDAIMARVAVFVVGVHVAVLAGLLGLLSGREWAAQAWSSRRWADLLDSHTLARDDDAPQAFYAGVSRAREIDHDANLYATYRQEEARLRDEHGGLDIRRVILEQDLKRDYQEFLQEHNRNRF